MAPMTAAASGLGESSDDRGLLGAACPEGPEIGAIALGLVSPERERARRDRKFVPVT